LGFSGSNDRSVIRVLKALKFLGPDGTPTARYNEYRDDSRSGVSMAAGLREGWAEVFLSDEKAYQKTTAQLTELMKSLTGSTEAVAQKMASTFKTLASKATWDVVPALRAEPAMSPPAALEDGVALKGKTSSLALHHDVHVHLPATSDVAVYTAIFRALRDELLD
jgi:hypothetical protein